jgi:hypothetical protein
MGYKCDGVQEDGGNVFPFSSHVFVEFRDHMKSLLNRSFLVGVIPTL